VPLDLPNLDNVTWQQLAEEGRSFIPGWAPEWTNHNAADPGITLVELFAYLSEMLIYRLNRISAANLRAFLRLINGLDWKSPKDLDEAKQETLANLRRTRRAVTAEDFERLACATNEALGSEAKEKVARAKAVFRRNLASDDPTARVSEAPGHISVIVVPNAESGHSEPTAELLDRVLSTLEPARLLTSRLHVVKPRYFSVGVRATLVISTTMKAQDVRQAAIKALKSFFDPIKGGPRGKGWPFGRSLYVSEVYELLAKLTGVRLVKRSTDPRTRRSIEELVVPPPETGRRRLNQDGRLEAIHLDPDELVRAQINGGDITVVMEDQSSTSDEW
jgi:hypothetical protein